MSEIGPINQPNPLVGSYAGKANGKSAPASTPSGGGGDEVNVSPTARLLGQLAGAGPAQVDVVATAGQLIESGFYDQPEVIQATVDALLADL